MHTGDVVAHRPISPCAGSRAETGSRIDPVEVESIEALVHLAERQDSRLNSASSIMSLQPPERVIDLRKKVPTM